MNKPECTKPDPTSQHTAKTIAPSYGARTFCSILIHYTGKKMTVAEQIEIINEHLEPDGRKPIKERTYYKWKAAARAEGLLHFKSTARRKRDRDRLTCNQQRREHGNGRQMTVLAIPMAVSGHRLRRSKKGSFSAPPEKGSFSAPIPLKDHSPKKDHSESVVVCAAKKTAPTPPTFFSREEKEIEKWLTEVGEIAADFTGYAYHARAEHFPKRSWAIRKALKEANAEKLALYVAGLAVERAKKPDWWESEGRDFDLVARAVAFAYQDHLYPHHETLEYYGEWVFREIELQREAMAGSA